MVMISHHNSINKIISLSILLQVIIINVYGQEYDNFKDKVDIPNGLTISVDSVKKEFSIMDKKVIGQITFSYKSKSVTYNIFNYNTADSVIFSKILMNRLSTENCMWKNNSNPNKNFHLSFIRDNYYYLIEYCPCGANSKGRCGNLALKINKWLKNKN